MVIAKVPFGAPTPGHEGPPQSVHPGIIMFRILGIGEEGVPGITGFVTGYRPLFTCLFRFPDPFEHFAVNIGKIGPVGLH